MEKFSSNKILDAQYLCPISLRTQRGPNHGGPLREPYQWEIYKEPY